jgi:hypothetical protein
MEKIDEMKGERNRKSLPEIQLRNLSFLQSPWRFFIVFLVTLLLALNAFAEAPRPLLFVHGNGDSAALW